MANLKPNPQPSTAGKRPVCDHLDVTLNVITTENKFTIKPPRSGHLKPAILLVDLSRTEPTGTAFDNECEYVTVYPVNMDLGACISGDDTAESSGQRQNGQPHTVRGQCEASALHTGSGLKYLCYFLHRFLSFRKAEVEALASMLGVQDISWWRPVGGSFFSPFWYVRLPSDDIVTSIAARSMLVKGFYELWGEGSSFEELEAALMQFLEGRGKLSAQSAASWKIVVDSWGKTMPLKEQVALINRLTFLNFKGPISLQHAQVVYRLIITSDKGGNGLPEDTTPVRWYFGREVAVSNRKVISQYKLPERLYIGPTSMDTEMAFVICSLARIKKGDLVYDPFVGTGSILVAASHLGAQTLGADIDMRVVRDGKTGADGKVLNNWANFRQYNLTPPAGLLRLDAHVPAFRTSRDGWLDAVVCDPPYGVESADDWYPPTVGYSLTECLQDLLDFAARHLRTGSRLVYFLPAVPDTCEGSNVPRHPALRFVSNCEQVLTRRYSRRLVTMEKWKAFDEADVIQPIDPEIESNLTRLHEMVYETRMERPVKQKYRGKVC